MVALNIVEAANRATATDKSAGRPYVAVFGGGTSGIGSYAALALARVHGEVGEAASRGLRVYILGRRAPDALLAALRAACPFGTFEVVQAKDLGLLRDVDRVCELLVATETGYAAKEGHAPKIDLLVASQGIMSFSGRQDTAEGLDWPTAIAYYGRARLVDRLLPLLTQAVAPAAVGHVVWVLNPGLEGDIVTDDLSLRNPKNFTLRNGGAHLSLFATFYLEALAARHPGTLALVHYYPGLVKTGIAQTSNLGFFTRALIRVAVPLMRLTSVPEAESGQRIAFLGTTAVYPPAHDTTAAAGARKLPEGTSVSTGADGTVGSGAYRITYDDEVFKHNDKSAKYREDGTAEKIYEHTQRAFSTIAAGNKFTE
ncbi:short-chain dehydrogenase/reductase [Sporothrix schenckii 1099-18]|uniref:Short-chain dehydrogenase/reductase n=1 Tax=Sporothrix schenckii 1099-18 TaxID=1397361 RepID=A0A0F2MEM0_SPOSC|nr:short-chain dehydrogenase/reductase [Sporothrix schenckii 1099-18]KJR87519.1 short-chain dehydrogenase/reductase [Sporothrix schenckii 1099-18]